jgi:integrase
MKGHIRERSPGHYAIILDVPDPATGKRKRRWHKFAGTKRQAQIECARLISEIQGGTYLQPDKTTLATFLDRWLEHQKSQVSPRSHERYAELCRKNIAPLLGAVILTKLRPAAISGAWTTALASGHRKGRGGLSPRTVSHMHTVLKNALGQAVRWELLARNPADAVDPPRIEHKQMTTYDLAQTAQLLDVIRGDRMLVPVMLAALCGLRRAEIVALRWGQVDLAGCQLAVVQSAEQTREGVRYKPPKSGRSRTVALTGTMTEELKALRIRQAQELLRLGVRQTDETMVCTLADGSALRPNTLTIYWARLVSTLNLPRIRFHDLRHACATHMLALGVHPKIAAERLGHSKVGITLDLYSHVMPGMQADAAALVDAALQMAISKRG